MNLKVLAVDFSVLTVGKQDKLKDQGFETFQSVVTYDSVEPGEYVLLSIQSKTVLWRFLQLLKKGIKLVEIDEQNYVRIHSLDNSEGA